MKIKILLLDDDPDVRFNLKIFLNDEGYNCRDFENADEALKALTNSKFNLAIVDLRLKGLSGEEFILEAHNIKPEMKFIIHTGSTDYWVSKEMSEIGMKQEDVFHKPIKDMNSFVSQINKLTAKGIDE